MGVVSLIRGQLAVTFVVFESGHGLSGGSNERK
jgi:hypothetical protein